MEAQLDTNHGIPSNGGETPTGIPQGTVSAVEENNVKIDASLISLCQIIFDSKW